MHKISLNLINRIFVNGNIYNSFTFYMTTAGDFLFTFSLYDGMILVISFFRFSFKNSQKGACHEEIRNTQ